MSTGGSPGQFFQHQQQCRGGGGSRGGKQQTAAQAVSAAAAAACGDPAMLRRALKISLSFRVCEVGQGPDLCIDQLLAEVGRVRGVWLGLGKPKKGCDIGPGSSLHFLAVPGGMLILKLSASTS